MTTNTTTVKRDKENASIGALTVAFVYADQLTGRARIGGVTDEEARTELAKARQTRDAILAGFKLVS